MKVLIIEDEYSLADAISETLNKEGFSVKVETDGEKGEDEKQKALELMESVGLAEDKANRKILKLSGGE